MKRKTEKNKIIIFRLLWVTIFPLLLFSINGCKSCSKIQDKQPTFSLSKCFVLKNEQVKVVIDHLHGGRIVEYSIDGNNILYVEKENPSWLFPDGNKYLGPAGGRFDVGPELTIPEHLQYWQGEWKVLESKPLYLKLASQEDKTLGFSLLREFKLDKKDSTLICTQTVKNISGKTAVYNHWFRTFAKGGGVCIVPIDASSRFPKQYILFGGWPDYPLVSKPRKVTMIEKHDDFLILKGKPANYDKVGIESYRGWFAYLHPSNLMFIKEFPVYPKRRYTNVTGTNVEFYYKRDILVELESLGPEEVLLSGESASYYEKWRLLPFTYPGSDKKLDLKIIENRVINK